MKKELNIINADWENKKKELLHQINTLKEAKLQLLDERNREKVAYEQAAKCYI